MRCSTWLNISAQVAVLLILASSAPGCSVNPHGVFANQGRTTASIAPVWSDEAPRDAGSQEDRVARVQTRALTRTRKERAQTQPGIAAPYSLARVTGTFGDCRPGGRQHRGLDISGVGPNSGLGTPVRAMTRAKILRVALPGTDVARYSRFDRRSGKTKRNKKWLPRSLEVPGYGPVYFFTRGHGRARTGVMIVTQAIGGPLHGHTIRYMHLGAIHPALSEGGVLEAGQELGLMGGTAVQESSPHVHIDIETPEGKRVDVAPFLGLEADHGRCKRKKRGKKKKRRKKRR